MGLRYFLAHFLFIKGISNCVSTYLIVDMNAKIFKYLNVLYLQEKALTDAQVKVLAYWELVRFLQEGESDEMFVMVCS